MRYIRFLFRYLKSCDHTIKGACDLVHGSASAWVAAAEFRPCWSCRGGDTRFFILPGDIAWRLGLRKYGLVGGKLSPYITMLPSFAFIDLV